MISYVIPTAFLLMLKALLFLTLSLPHYFSLLLFFSLSRSLFLSVSFYFILFLSLFLYTDIFKLSWIQILIYYSFNPTLLKKPSTFFKIHISNFDPRHYLLFYCHQFYQDDKACSISSCMIFQYLFHSSFLIFLQPVSSITVEF